MSVLSSFGKVIYTAGIAWFHVEQVITGCDAEASELAVSRAVA